MADPATEWSILKRVSDCAVAGRSTHVVFEPLIEADAIVP
jgi:hypothetical protein